MNETTWYILEFLYKSGKNSDIVFVYDYGNPGKLIHRYAIPFAFT